MSIRILESSESEQGERSIALVEHVDPATHQPSVTWQFVCELCDEYRSGVSEQEARDAFAHHACKVLQEF